MTTDGVPKRGEIIAGKFRVDDVLGAGGMGIVVAARDLALHRRVAVKFLTAQAARLPEASARFMREARAAVAIQSEHVARVIDVGAMSDGAPYMVMEFLAGTDFSRLLKQRGALPIADALDYVLQAGEAIAEAHALGIVHRDLKPGNLFLTTRPDGSSLVKVLDFGLSKMTAADGSAPEGSLTATGFVAGSPFYMSPEQVRSLRDVDLRTDVWALGVILYELLTAKRPFDGPSLTAVCASIIADTPVSMRALRPEIPEQVERAAMACLERDLGRRTRSVAELAQAIAPFAPPRSIGSVERIARLVPGAASLPRVEDAGGAVGAAFAAPVEMPRPGIGPGVATGGDVPRRQIVEAPVAPMVAPVAPGASMAVPAAPAGAAPPAPMVAPAAMVTKARLDNATSVTGQSGNWGQTSPVERRAPMAKRVPIEWIAGGLATLAFLLSIVVWLLRSGHSSPASEVGASTGSARAPARASATVTATTAPIDAPAVPSPVVTTAASAEPLAGAPSAPTASGATPTTPEAAKTASPSSQTGKSEPPKKSPSPVKPPPRRKNILDQQD